MLFKSSESDRQLSLLYSTLRELRNLDPMKKYTTDPLVASLGAALLSLPLSAEPVSSVTEEPETLDPYVVVASRIEEPLSQVTKAVSVLDEFEGSLSLSLQDHLGNRVPGALSTSTAGQRGQPGSLFLRGTNTDQAQLRVDGIRLSDSNVLLGSFLGASSLSGLERIEVLRGPQSAVYGGEAIGGVVALSSASGEGDPSISAFGEVGSFDSFSFGAETQGALDSGLSYRLGYTHEQTANDLPGNDFEQNSYHLRLDQTLNPSTRIGLTFRRGDADYETPQDGPQESTFDYQLGTIFIENQFNEIWSATTRLGYYEQDLRVVSPFFTSTAETEKLSFSTDHEWAWHDSVTTRAGFIWEETDFASSLGDQGRRTNVGFYGQQLWQPADALLFKAGARWEDYDDFGDEFTWDFGARFNISNDLSIKTNYGRAFRTPNFSELFGSNFTSPSPNLTPETSTGWDLGIEKEFGSSQNRRLSLTWFENDIEDTIQTVFFGSAFNVPGKTKASGLEAALSWGFENPDVELRAAYTYLDRSLSGLPEQVASLRVGYEPTNQLNLALNVEWVDQRSYGGTPLDAYWIANLRAEYALNDQVTLYGRVDNLFDESYRLASFSGTDYPARGRGIFFGARVDY